MAFMENLENFTVGELNVLVYSILTEIKSLTDKIVLIHKEIERQEKM